MKKRTFLIISIISIFLMMGWFTVELISRAEMACIPRIDMACMNSMQRLCNDAYGEHMGQELSYSHCENGSCFGLWKFYCDVGNNQKHFWIYCREYGNWMCADW